MSHTIAYSGINNDPDAHTNRDAYFHTHAKRQSGERRAAILAHSSHH